MSDAWMEMTQIRGSRLSWVPGHQLPRRLRSRSDETASEPGRCRVSVARDPRGEHLITSLALKTLVYVHVTVRLCREGVKGELAQQSSGSCRRFWECNRCPYTDGTPWENDTIRDTNTKPPGVRELPGRDVGRRQSSPETRLWTEI